MRRAPSSSMDKDQLSRDELELALKTFRQAAVYVRAYDRRALMRYRGLDTAAVVREVFESAVLMGREALMKLGVSGHEADRVEREYRMRDCQRLELQRTTGDLRSGRDRIFGVDRPLADEEATEPA